MSKFYATFAKEFLLLKEDFLGMLVLFLMPVVLILTITPIQNSVENNEKEANFPVLFVNHDKGALSQRMIEELQEGNKFKLIQSIDGKALRETKAKKLLLEGKNQLLIVIPSNFSVSTQGKIQSNIDYLLQQIMPSSKGKIQKPTLSAQEIAMYFNPLLPKSVKNNIQTSIDKSALEMETKMIYQAFEKELGTDLKFISQKKLIHFKENSLISKPNKPNPVQHNTFAWALVAIFLIVVPLSNNLVKEKNQGTYLRLKTMPVRPLTLLLAKISVFTLICLLQFYLMLLVSHFVFPLIGLPAFLIGTHFLSLTCLALFSSLAAVGLGVLIGTIAKTHEQAAPFGAMTIIILAALGGLWFPVYAMSSSMQKIAAISPMNWGLEAFYSLIANNRLQISLLFALFAFFVVTLVLSLAYEKKINRL